MQLDDEYLGFLESIDRGLAPDSLDGPDDEPLPSSWIVGGSPVRLRLGGVSLSDFREMMPRITPLESPNRDAAARTLRLNQLREVLRPERLPLIDIHLPNWVNLTEDVLRIAQLGGWYKFRLERRLRGRMAPVFFAYPEIDTLQRAFLAAFDVAPEGLAARLRDIFSLAHVGDWGADDGPGGAPISPPLLPMDSRDLEIIRIPCTGQAPQVEIQRAMLSTERAKPQVQHVKVGL